MTGKDGQSASDVASADSCHTFSIPCHCCGSIEEYEHFEADFTLMSQNLPDRKDQLVSYFAIFLQLPLGAVREHRNRGKMPQVAVTNHHYFPFCRTWLFRSPCSPL